MAGPDLVHRRQFIMAAKELEALRHWTKVRLNGTSFVIHAHPDLDVEVTAKSGRSLVLLGYIFDARNPHYTNKDILEVLALENSFEGLVRATHEYGGRFVLAYSDRLSARLLHDAGGLRQVYYARSADGLWCGSQPSILARFLDLQKSGDAALREFCESGEFILRHKAWVGDATPYDEVKHLMPNHYLDLSSGESRRYWPDKKIEEASIKEAVEAGAEYLSGFLACACERYKLMQAVTAGWDSRVLLAASRRRRDEILYFINKHRHLTDKSPDIRVPRRLLSGLGLGFHVIEYPDAVDDGFRIAFSENVTLSRETHLPVIYNVYHRRFPDKMVVNGDVSPIARNYFDRKKNISGAVLAKLCGYGDLAYPTRECTRWLQESGDTARDHKMDVLDLFYWEQRIGNWGALAPAESDISVEQFSPFNCRSLLVLLLSVDRRHRDWHSNRLYEALIKRMWSETLREPVNPSLRTRSIRALKVLRLYPIAKRFREKVARA